LFAAQISLSGQDGGVPQKELDLFEFTSVHVAELCAASPKIVGREVVEL